MPLPLPESFCHGSKIPRLVVGVEGEALQSRPAIHHTDVQLRAEFYGLSRLSPHNGAQERLTDADDPVRNRVAALVVHVLLLLIERPDRCETVAFSLGKGSAQSNLSVNGGQVSSQIAQLFPNRFADLLRRLLTAAAELKKIPVRLSAVGAGLFPVGRIIQLVQQLFCVFPSLVEKRCVLRVADVGGRAGGVHNHGAAVAAISAVVIILVRRFLLHCTQDHLIDH